MTEYFTGPVIFALHPACDAQYQSQSKNVEENVAYLKYTSPSSIINPSKLKFHEPSTV